MVCFCCSVPPVIYRRVKQAPDNKRESQLIKELEEILSKEGLSSNPSEKGWLWLFCLCLFVPWDVSCDIHAVY